MTDVMYAIRLKINKTLLSLAREQDDALTKATRLNMVDYAVTYEEFWYQAASWRPPRRVVFKIEKPYNQLTHMYTFIVTNMEELGHWQVIITTATVDAWRTLSGKGNRVLILRP